MPRALPDGIDTALALQGGGAHGAFTWGVLDRLLESGFGFQAVTGVSSGAMIGAMAVQGLVKGGAAGAQAALTGFWDRVASRPAFGFNAPPAGGFNWMWGGDGGEAARAFGKDMAAGFSNALKLLNPPNQTNPLQTILDDVLDLDALRSPRAPRLYVAATDVETGKPKVFDNVAIDRDVLLASACLPSLFPAVRIGGRAYWDGGFSCNPALWPVLDLKPRRLVLIRAQPTTRLGVPTGAVDILHRLQELAFQAPLETALRDLPPDVVLTDVTADAALARHPPLSRLSTDGRFLKTLFEAGRDAAGLPAAA